MTLKDFLQEINDETKEIISSDFSIEIKETDYTPNVDDSDITYDNFDKKYKKCKIIETCVLYIDIRKSTELNLKHRPQTLAKLYSSFIRNTIRSAQYFDGHVRDIVGDRLMVVFDKKDCFKNAVKTAILLNSVTKYIINKNFKNNDVNCGIGIDFGEMLVVKAGTIKQGKENQFYKSLVWLGKPANIASKLTDVANKNENPVNEVVRVLYHSRSTGEFTWLDESYSTFLDDLQVTYSQILKHKDENFSAFHKPYSFTSVFPPILMTKEVYDGFKKECPGDATIENDWWKKQEKTIPSYKGDIYGGDIIFKEVYELT